MWLVSFQVAWRCFDVAAQYFEEILFDLLAGVDICGAAEVPKKQAGKWMASKSSLDKVL